MASLTMTMIRLVKRTFGALTVFALAAGLVACGAEPMTVNQACNANANMERNEPQGEVAEAQYRLPFYREWSQRIDGALGAAFAGMAKIEESTIAAGKQRTDDDALDQVVNNYGVVLRICKGI